MRTKLPESQQIELSREEWTELFDAVGSAGMFFTGKGKNGEALHGMLLFAAKFIKLYPNKPESKDLHPAKELFVYCR